MACAQGGTVTPDLAPDLEAGRQVFSASCATCHGGNGQGGSAPALADVLTTFSDCDDHVRWVSMGSERHKAEVGPTYGDTGKEITAIMPEFGASLSDTEIAQVAAFERHRFGGAGEATALADCGL
jgi:mono/diheme cytochrome c family protein